MLADPEDLIVIMCTYTMDGAGSYLSGIKLVSGVSVDLSNRMTQERCNGGAQIPCKIRCRACKSLPTSSACMHAETTALYGHRRQ